MRIVADELEILIGEIEQRADLAVDLHAGKRAGRARQLLVGLVEVIEIEMDVAEGMDEFAGRESGDVRHHQREQSIGCDVERHAKKDVGGALIELAGESPVGDIELDKEVAGGESNLVELTHVH